MPDNGDVNHGRINEVKQVLGPGMWIDGDGHGHINIPQMLQHLGMKDTPENHALAVEAAKEMLAKHGMTAKYRKSPDDPGFPL